MLNELLSFLQSVLPSDRPKYVFHNRCSLLLIDAPFLPTGEGEFGGRQVERRGRRRSCRGHHLETSARLRHRVGDAQVPDVLHAEHEHRARTGNGALQQAARHDQGQSGERAQGDQGQWSRSGLKVKCRRNRDCFGRCGA